MLNATPRKKKYVLQLCHDYSVPYLDVTRQYASLFKNTDYHIISVYLIGPPNDRVIKQSDSDQVLFLNNRSQELRGLKRKQIKQVKQLCQQYSFEFAIGHRYKALFILRHINNLPVIGIHHSFGNYQRFMRRWFVQHHQHNLCLIGVSNAIREDIRQALPHYPKTQIQTLYNRIQPEQVRLNQVSRQIARQQLGIAEDHYVFANVGRLHPDKDQKTLINAFAKIAPKLPNSLLVILGKGRLEDALHKQIQYLQLEHQVRLLGSIPEAVNYYRAFDCFVLSSDYEPFGMVLLEAIIADIPIIATNVGGAKEIIPDSNWLFPIADEIKLSQLMWAMSSKNTNQLKTLTDNNQQWLQKNFTDKAVKHTFWSLDCIQQIIANNPNRS
jgi:glycosyltransferase involved in cell wall biosynthesis